jgi:putative cardiolipin synthase
MAFLLSLLLVLGGCAGLPSQVERLPSTAIADADGTTLGRLAGAARPDPQLSGFRLLPMPDAPDLLGHNPLAQDLDAGADALALAWAPAEAFSDAPEKVLSTVRAAQPLTEGARDTVLYNVRRRVRAAEREVVVTTPYLIPGREGMESLRLVRRCNVQFSIVTNSLAATDETLVHAGYSRYRLDMLRLGVELYELSPKRAGKSERFGAYGSSGGRLHGKSAVIDRDTVFIGSFNFDPRSDAHNTELGVFISSPAIAQQLYSLIGFIQREGAYKLRLTAGDPPIEWIGPAEEADGTPETIYRDEPEADGWARWKLFLLSPLIPEHLL